MSAVSSQFGGQFCSLVIIILHSPNIITAPLRVDAGKGRYIALWVHSVQNKFKCTHTHTHTQGRSHPRENPQIHVNHQTVFGKHSLLSEQAHIHYLIQSYAPMPSPALQMGSGGLCQLTC